MPLIALVRGQSLRREEPKGVAVAPVRGSGLEDKIEAACGLGRFVRQKAQ